MTTAIRQPSPSQEELRKAEAPCFIEHQFPVAPVSAESYKERKAVAGQTLTGLGKWWGRKPLVLVRASILGLLLPATDDPKRDREIFLKFMTMDGEGLWRRKDKAIPQARLLAELLKMPPSVQEQFLEPKGTLDRTKKQEQPPLRKLSRQEREELERLVFECMPYSEKLQYCCRPEQIDGPSPEAWQAINSHLGTQATSLPELVEELGRRRFGHRPRVGDSFCGAGSVPFEAARLGCDVYGSDLSPVAALLTWAALNIVGGGEKVARQVQEAQRMVFEAVDRQVTEWGIEHNELGWRADAFLYCVEVLCPECGWRVPLAPSWVIAEKNNVVAELVPDELGRRFEVEIHEGVSRERMKRARDSGTVKNSRLECPHCGQSTPIEVIRRNLRLWENDNLVPRPDDVFQERLYCIRWVEKYYERKVGKLLVELSEAQAEALPDFRELLESGVLKEKTRRHYCAPTPADLKREAKVLKLLKERFNDCQQQGYIPRRRIEPGVKTDEPIRTRGWTHWHHLFTPRQLLVASCFAGQVASCPHPITGLLLLGRVTNGNNRLSRWKPTQGGGIGGVVEVFSNQALNTLYDYAGRGIPTLESLRLRIDEHQRFPVYDAAVRPSDSRNVATPCEIWITDPPYADAINYHELGEFFLAWYEKHLPKLFPDGYTDSKRALAIKGGNQVAFRQGMVECYRRLVEHMPDNGLQVVMFTHQDVAVWADLSLILWAAGLRVTGAWCIATETDSALKVGNYVQGTVLLVCRKRTEEEPVFLDEIVHRVETEVRRQLDAMLQLEDESEPNFGDADYQLAAYAAALRVLTERSIEEIDPAREIARVRPKGEVNPVEQLIRNAVKIACDHLVPRGIDRELWKTLSPLERFNLKGLEVETHGERRIGVYQELARGFGAADYDELLASTKANQTRIKTASEFGRRMLSGDGFASTLVRQILFAVHQVAKNEEVAVGRSYLRTEIAGYWNEREKIVEILEYLGALRNVGGLEHWRKDAEAAALLAGAVRNDHV